MLVVFAVWALSGFGYPSAPVPITLNVVSKILAFVTLLTLFLLPRDQAATSEPRAGAASVPRLGTLPAAPPVPGTDAALSRCWGAGLRASY